ncbi:hypothetical protein [Paenibacillus sp.]|uniref:hypothetical protein n=1 Tax=Paenibacillus sp. TaxID=58172 RepID=UPI00281174CE|nr:hypothetical protein [Paenibacillus sp.]
MTRSTLRPMGVGPMLDRSLQVYRKLFASLFLGTLLAFGPFYLVSNVLLVNLDALPLVPNFDFGDMDRFWESRFSEELFAGGTAVWARAVGIFLIGLVLVFLVVPVYFAWAVILSNRAIDGEATTSGDALREAWRRYGRVLGNGLLYWLISMGAYSIVSVGNFVLSLVYGGAILSTAALGNSEAAVTAAGAFALVVYVLFAYGGALAYYYFLIRFGYFLPPLLFENESVAIGRSWSLTRRSFWRLLAVYINFAALTYVFAVAVGIVVAGLGVSVVGLLLTLVVVSAFLPAGLVVYALTYRVQKTRTDADDIEAALARLRGPDPTQGSEPREAEGTR